MMGLLWSKATGAEGRSPEFVKVDCFGWQACMQTGMQVGRQGGRIAAPYSITKDYGRLFAISPSPARNFPPLRYVQ